jgi:hypothetical protein
MLHDDNGWLNALALKKVDSKKVERCVFHGNGWLKELAV